MAFGSGITNKADLRNEFSKDYSKYYSVKLFEDKGFKRHKCRICGIPFWSIKERDVCEDPAHTEYSFFRDSPRQSTYVDFWKSFADFFKKNGHEEIKRYPVVSRWRQDLYFTIASIQDFQRIENGKMSFEYSANPLVVPQICLRFRDIENVGITGRHFTGFMMAGQHSFNAPKEGYWKDRTIELNYKYLTEVLGVKAEDLVYTEDAWAMPDFSEFGPCLESFANGVEIVNSVFTEFELVNGSVRELDGKVVDVGWGLERLLWFYTGMDNAYSAVFGKIVDKLESRISAEIDQKLFAKFSRYSGELNIDEIKNLRTKEAELLGKAGITQDEYAKKIKPLQALYAVLDHIRTLLFGISDGSLPSNVGGGYNLRIILRRSMDFIEKYNLGIDLTEVASEIARDLKPLYPELESCISSGEFSRIIKVEEERYAKSKESAGRTIDAILSKGGTVSVDQLKVMYQSNGITPEFIINAAASKGKKISLPESYYESLITGDIVKKERQKAAVVDVPESVPHTIPLYYKLATESKSKVLYAKNGNVVLDQTPFYPEGGGQAADKGTINGVNVVDVQKQNGIVIHTLEKGGRAESISEGMQVEARVDEEARMRLIAHHTATHLISASSRKILGNHAWQEGARKETDKAHIDIAHYSALTEEQLESIESLANTWIFNGIRVKAEEMDRGEAEKLYGFEIYQGHGIPSKRMRVIIIEDKKGNLIDAEACGGLHATGIENYLGIIKITSSYRLHDGIDRIEFVAGPAALSYFRKEDKELKRSASAINSSEFSLADKVEELKSESKSFYKKSEHYKELLARQVAGQFAKSDDRHAELDMSRDMLRMIANLAMQSGKDVILLYNPQGDVVCASSAASKISAREFINEKFGQKGFVGGGSPNFVEGKIK
jgi:alanyl-tRNA synthetase